MFVPHVGNITALLEGTLTGLGYEVVALEVSRGGLVRVFIDRRGGVNVEDCATVSNHLTRLFAVEGVDYERLEVSSPGLDRPLRGASDFERFAGARAQIKMRVPVAGRRNFTGVLRGVSDSAVKLEVGGALVSLDLTLVDKARLAPE